MSQGTRFGVVAVVIMLAIGGFVIANQSTSDDPAIYDADTTTSSSSTRAATDADTSETTQSTSPAPTTPRYRVTVRGAKPIGGVKRIRLDKGDPVDLTVSSDVADGIHIHGYDIEKEIKPGGRVRFRFPAKIDGNFEIELENRGVQIAELSVQP